ncbi:MAG: hypothetical protein AAGN35_03215 [Bacteroidota bacterium]
MQKSISLLALVILFSCLLPAQLSGQGRWKRFWQLSGPERGWVIGHLWVAGKADRIARRALVLTDSVATAQGFAGSGNGDLQDAFRHGIWMAQLGQEIGLKKARKLGLAREKGQYQRWKRGKLGRNSGVDSTARAMDLWNNEKAFAIADRLPRANEAALTMAVLRDLEAGLFRVILRDAAGYYRDAGGSRILLNRLIDVWETPRCLVPSQLTIKEPDVE